MKKNIFLGLIIFCALSNTIHAQYWHFYNPTIGYDINTVEILRPGVIAIGGGKESDDSTEIMFQTSDYGLTWYENAHDGLKPWIKSMAFSDNTAGFAVGYEGRIIRSDDAGGTWGHDTVPINRDFNKIVYAGAGTYFVVGGEKSNDSMQTILESIDYGQTWYVIYDNLGPWLRSVFFMDTQNGFAVGDNGAIISTTDGGSTWMYPVPPVVRDFDGITFINANTGFIIGGSTSGAGRKTILQTTDGGLNWNVLLDTTGAILKDISFADSLVGYIVGDSATVLKTIDGGLTWVTLIIDSTLTGNESFNAVKFYDRNFGAIGGKYGGLYVFTDFRVEPYTLGSEHVGLYEATLKGAINTHTKNAKYSFIYSSNILFSSSLNTQEVNIKNDSLALISENIQGLTPNTTYYYYLKATTATDTVYADTLSFYTGVNPFIVFQTLNATSVGTWAANLNGYICKFPELVNLFFEYGTSPVFDSLVTAAPAILNDTLPHLISASIAGLQANKQYFFRLKGVTATNVYYGDTKMFNAVNLPWATTQNASDISLTSALLNGNITNNGFPAAIKFEYGLTTFYDSVVDAVPDSAINNVNILTSYSLNGLTPFTTYHFRIKATNLNGTSFGDDREFITGGPSVSALSASDLGLYSAQLNGVVNANNVVSVSKFEYGLTTGYGHEVAAMPDSVTGNANTDITCLLSGLLQDTTYHYRVKATSAIGTNYSDDRTFRTKMPPLLFTLTATEITLNSAKLNGSMNAGGIPTVIKFEYGNSTSYGNEVIAVPDSSYTSGDIDAYAMITGLMPNTSYHFRIKVINSKSIYYGEDMIFFTGSSEIPNFDFESWTTAVFLNPQNFDRASGKITKFTPACLNNFAVKIENDTSNGGSSGGIMIGDTYDGNAFFGGVPFNARPDTLKGCFNYYIPNNDTAVILFLLKKQGIIISKSWFKIYGNSSGNYIDLNFPIPYISSGNADTLIIGISVTDIRNHNPLTSEAFLIVDNIHFSGTTENIPNNDFENWETNTLYTLNNWWHNNTNTINPIHPENITISPSMDAQHGSFAVLVQNFILPADTIWDFISTSKNWSAPGFSVNGRHQSVTGYYKFIPENNDTMTINVGLFKNNTNIGHGAFQSADLVTNYTPFIININSNDTVVPDSGNIIIQSCLHKPRGNSKLYIDNLNFDGFLSGIKEPVLTASKNFDFNVYPNPFNEQATVAFTIEQNEKVLVRLFDLSGKQVALLANGNYSAGNHSINLSAHGLKKGFYICVINTENAFYSKKLIIY